MRVAMSIAGSDSISGAGIQADLKTFASFNVYGTAVITALTAQNTKGVYEIFYPPADFVKKQIDAVISDCKIDAAKTGMLGKAEIVNAVAKALKKYEIPLIIDPVILYKSKAVLLEEDAFNVLLEKLIPLAKIVTPNIDEAERICGMEIKNLMDAEFAAKKIVKDFGCESAVVKGGHLNLNEATDILYFNGRIYRFSSKRIEGCFHGTGCAFSAAIAANIAKGNDIIESVKIAKNYIDECLKYSLEIGKGCLCLNNTAIVSVDAERWRMLHDFKKVLSKLLKIKNFHKFIPEVGTNFAYAMPADYLKDLNDVLAIEGRIVRGLNRAIAGKLRFGVSSHLARAIIAYMEFNPEMRCAINIKYERGIIEKAKLLGFEVSCYDRRKEPEEIKGLEGRTIQWGIKSALSLNKNADLIYHEGDLGKEPMILIFGKNPSDILKKLLRLLESI